MVMSSKKVIHIPVGRSTYQWQSGEKGKGWQDFGEKFSQRNQTW